jgi:hypothetical protein
MRKNNQKGITTVKSALFVIIFALIAFIGWYVVGNNDKSKTQLNQTASDSIKTTNIKSLLTCKQACLPLCSRRSAVPN